MRRAVFLDRDGTLIEDPGYLRDPAAVQLLPGAGQAMRDLAAAGFALVVVTNQSGVARGYFNEICLAAVHDRMRQVLAGEGVRLDGLYYCPYHPEAVVEAYRKQSDWRKPGCGMLKAAAADLGLDLGASWMVGDSACDVEAGRRAGCRTVRLGLMGEDGCGADFVAGDLAGASRRILEASKVPGAMQVGSHGH